MLDISARPSTGEAIRVDYEKPIEQIFFDVLKFVSPQNNIMSFASILLLTLGISLGHLPLRQNLLFSVPLKIVGYISETKLMRDKRVMQRVRIFPATIGSESGDIEIETKKPATYQFPVEIDERGSLICQVADSTKVFLLCEGYAGTICALCKLRFRWSDERRFQSFMNLAQNLLQESKNL